METPALVDFLCGGETRVSDHLYIYDVYLAEDDNFITWKTNLYDEYSSLNPEMHRYGNQSKNSAYFSSSVYSILLEG